MGISEGTDWLSTLMLPSCHDVCPTALKTHWGLGLGPASASLS